MGTTTQDDKVNISLFLSLVHVGSLSHADDYIDKVLDLNELVVSNAAANFFVRVSGDSMMNAAIKEKPSAESKTGSKLRQIRNSSRSRI